MIGVLLAACSAPELDETTDLPLGDLGADDSKADGNWGAALTCKTIPNLPALSHPEITVSLEGLTLHLVDRTVGYDKVFPIGPGMIDTDPTSATFGESKSYYPVIASGRGDFKLRKATNTACKFWWTDPDTGEKLPVFAGLPFLSWSGSYGIHGPIDNYRAANGGNLRRGFVSHGCVRMEAADVLEVYARVKDTDGVPVHVQREPERRAGVRIDLAANWVGAECQRDADCRFPGGLCHANRYSGRGFCTVRCTQYCSDRAGYPATFCVPDPDAAGQGMCVAKATTQDQDCRPFDGFVPKTSARNGQPSVTASVCLPGSRGWVGARCFASGDCQNSTRCAPAASPDGAGTCTEACTSFCPDEPGFADTFCVAEPALGGPSCLRQCTLPDAPECPAGTRCVARARSGGTVTRTVCEPG